MSQVGFETRFDVRKFDDAEQIVFGWANVSVRKDGTLVIDSEEDTIELADLEAAAYDFVLNAAATGDMHEGGVTGQLVESMVFTPEKLEAMNLPEGSVPAGWWVGFHVDDREVFDKVRKRERSMFSIQGTAIRERI